MINSFKRYEHTNEAINKWLKKIFKNLLARSGFRLGFVNTKSELSPRSLRRKASLEKSQLKENAGKHR